MATRNRTQAFLQYRQSFNRNNRQNNQGFYDAKGESEKIGLISPTPKDTATHNALIDMTVLPPVWIDDVHTVETEIASLKKKIVQLDGLYKKNLLPGFDEVNPQEANIEKITNEINKSIKAFQICHQKVKKMEKQAKITNATEQELTLCKNIQISLATQIQKVTGEFRKTQSNYLSKIQGRAFATGKANNNTLFTDDVPITPMEEGGFTNAQVAESVNNEAIIREREQEINDIARSINDIAIIFKDMQTLVIEQGTVLDRIDYNVEQAAVHIKDAAKELEKGEQYQKQHRKKLIIMILMLVVLGMIVALVLKIKSKSSSSGSSNTSTPSPAL